MGSVLPRLIFPLLLALIVGLPWLIRPLQPRSATAPPAATGALRLILITPNNEQIRAEFAQGFNAHRQALGLAPVHFDWRASGGASELRRTVVSQFESRAARNQQDQGIGADLFFGGGTFEHDLLAQPRRSAEGQKYTLSVPPQLPAAILAEAFPNRSLAGVPLVHPENHWIGTALSSFGIVYNRDVLQMLSLPEPQTWADLSDPAYHQWVILADPAHAGSIAATYATILRREGWMEGWALLRRIFANTRSFAASASKVPVDVSAGEAAAGMCIDFYGRFQAGAVGGERMGYIDPPGATAITPDPISLLRGAPHRETAEAFIAWLLSPQAQQLWQRRRVTTGSALHGPRQFELRRQPIRADLYTPDEQRYWTDPTLHPFETARPLPEGMPDVYRLVAPVSHAIAIDIHADLVAAWTALNRWPAGHPRRMSLEARFDAMPEDLSLQWPTPTLARSWQTILADPTHPDHAQVREHLAGWFEPLFERYRREPDALLQDRLRWTLFFKAQYRQIVVEATTN